MMCGGVVFFPVVGVVSRACAIIETIFFLVFSVTYPLELHVHGFCVIRLYFFIDYSFLCGLVSLHWCYMLSVS